MSEALIAYYSVEACHKHGKLVIQFLPEFREDILRKLADNDWECSPVSNVECWKFTISAGKYLELTMQQVEIEYSSESVSWFSAQTWKATE